MMEPRAYHGCTVTRDGEVMVLGGLNNDFYIRTVAVFDPRTEVRATGRHTGTRGGGGGQSSAPHVRWGRGGGPLF